MHSSALAAMQARSVCSWPIVHPEELFQTRNTCGNIIFKNQGKEGRQHLWQEKWMIISISVLCGRESQRSPALFLPIFSLVFPPLLSILQSCSRAEPTQALHRWSPGSTSLLFLCNTLRLQSAFTCVLSSNLYKI